MKRFFSRALMGALLVVSSVSCRADEPKTPPTAAQLQIQSAPIDWEKTGQTWAFLGDSITNSGGYHQYIQLFLATRYPGRDFWTVNAGRSGDKAEGALGDGRVDFDVKPFAPSVVFVHFGMNDVGWTGYKGKNSTGADWQVKRMGAFTKSMTSLVEEVRGIGATPVIVSPTMYDDTSTRQKFNLKLRLGLNDELGRYGAWGREMARQNGLPFVDVHTPMTQLSETRQKQEADFALTRDRVHPNDMGDEFFAYQILKELKPQPFVYRVEIDAAKNKAQAQGATVVSHQASPQKAAFTLNESALPFPLAKDDGGFKSLVPFSEELNQQTLRVSGLDAGTYEIRIDGAPVAVAEAKELAQGLDLSANEKTPQYQAALKLRELILPEKMELERARRDMAVMMLNIGPDKYNWETSDEAALAELQKWHDSKPNKSGWNGYLNSQNRKWIPRRTEVKNRLEEIRQQLAATPRESKHSYEIARVAQ